MARQMETSVLRRLKVAPTESGDSMTVGLVSIANPSSQGAEVRAETGEFKIEGGSATFEVERAPFSETEMAERVAADPVFYRNLAVFVASELRRQADNANHQGNIGAVVKGQLTELAEGFESTAAILTGHEGLLTPQAAQQAAETISKLRDAYATFSESHPELVQLAVIGLAGYVLHQFGGVTADISLLVSYAVVKKEKLGELFSSWTGKK
jgi:hypothetical protein